MFLFMFILHAVFSTFASLPHKQTKHSKIYDYCKTVSFYPIFFEFFSDSLPCSCHSFHSHMVIYSNKLIITTAHIITLEKKNTTRKYVAECQRAQSINGLRILYVMQATHSLRNSMHVGSFLADLTGVSLERCVLQIRKFFTNIFLLSRIFTFCFFSVQDV